MESSPIIFAFILSPFFFIIISCARANEINENATIITKPMVYFVLMVMFFVYIRNLQFNFKIRITSGIFQKVLKRNDEFCVVLPKVLHTS
jgi:hypothetical protein